jgi:hypothetical protein
VTSPLYVAAHELSLACFHAIAGPANSERPRHASAMTRATEPARAGRQLGPGGSPGVSPGRRPHRRSQLPDIIVASGDYARGPRRVNDMVVRMVGRTERGPTDYGWPGRLWCKRRWNNNQDCADGSEAGHRSSSVSVRKRVNGPSGTRPSSAPWHSSRAHHHLVSATSWLPFVVFSGIGQDNVATCGGQIGVNVAFQSSSAIANR